MSENTSLDSLLDSTLDDLADMPEFKSLKDGHHRVSIHFEIIPEFKMKEGPTPVVKAKVKLLETIELADPTQVVDEVGTESETIYNLTNEFGQGQLKEILKPLGAHFGVSGIKQTLEAAEGAEVFVTTKSRTDKNDTTKKYFGIKTLSI
jgi:hypothetical protein